MQLASSGYRALKGAQAHFFPSGGTTQVSANATRAIHIPAYAPRPATVSKTQTAIKRTRNLLSRFVAHLTTPGTLRAPADVVSGASRARAFHGPATRMPSIQDRMSYTTRTFLSRPPTVPFLPRAPAVPRNIAQVGLGTARNFTTGRPVFQHLAENVPIYARAFSEADWKVQMQEERERLKMEKAKAKAHARKARKAQVALRPLKPVKAATTPAVSEPKQEELEHYFPAPAAPEVTTHLLIPLAPTPTTRLPLSPNPSLSSARPLLPLELIASMHTSHGTHALRVSTLFARLDTSHVFDDPGVHCEARGDPSGLCTVLEVRFEGWTASRVRGVIGESGMGWCVLDEVWRDEERVEAEEMDAALETMSAVESDLESHAGLASLSGLLDMNGNWDASAGHIDPARSFVLPTLDFSASFAAPSWSSPSASRGPPSMSSALEDLQFQNEWLEIEDGFSSPASLGDYDADHSSDGESSVSAWMGPAGPAASGSEESWFRFSSQFSERMRSSGSEGPREELF